MNRAVLVICSLTACSGSSSPVAEPQQTTEGLAQPSPLPAKTCETPVNAQPAQTLVCKTPPPSEGFIPSGFWCAESRKTADHPPLNVCYSTEVTCSKLRQEGIDSGAMVSTCRPRESAYCFTMIQAVEQKVYWRCYETMEECQPLRTRWISEQPKLTFGECSLKGVGSAQTRR